MLEKMHGPWPSEIRELAGKKQLQASKFLRAFENKKTGRGISDFTRY